jgi:hypothetical protein
MFFSANFAEFLCALCGQKLELDFRFAVCSPTKRLRLIAQISRVRIARCRRTMFNLIFLHFDWFSKGCASRSQAAAV